MKHATFSLMMLSLSVIAVPGCGGNDGPHQVVDESDKAAIHAYIEEQEQREAEVMKQMMEELKKSEELKESEESKN